MNIIHWKQCQITIQSLSGIWMSKIRFDSRETNFSLHLSTVWYLTTQHFLLYLWWDIKLKLQKCIALTSEPLDHIILIPIKLGTKHFLIKCFNDRSKCFTREIHVLYKNESFQNNIVLCNPILDIGTSKLLFIFFTIWYAGHSVMFPQYLENC